MLLLAFASIFDSSEEIYVTEMNFRIKLIIFFVRFDNLNTHPSKI